MNIKVSVIIPIYNSELYLTNCIESVLNQSLKEIEIILVNDCSTDSSFLIMQDYKNRYPDKIKIINLKTKKGPGGARNEGIKIASGKYIGFVDSDDDIFYTMYEELYNYAEESNCDIVDSSFYYELTGEEINTTIKKATGILDDAKRKELILHSGFVWSKIYRRNMIINNNIKFRENTCFEDIDFLRVTILYCQKIGSIDSVLYNYRDTLSSISGTEDTAIQVYEKINSIKSLINSFTKLGVYTIYKEQIKYLALKTYNCINNFILSANNTANNKIMEDINNFYRNYCI